MAQPSIILIDSSSDSLTVSWPTIHDFDSGSTSTRYVLQYRKDTHDSSFETLTDKLTSTQARKRNLSDEITTTTPTTSNGVGFFFRVTTRPEKEDFDVTKEERYNWITHQGPFYLMKKMEESKRMDPPTVTLAGSNLALRVAWKSHQETATTGYELQMRENEGGVEWVTIAPCISGLEVKKKNLKSKNGYQFRVRPVADQSKDTIPFSSPSPPVVALGLSQELARLFSSVEEGKLLRQHNQPPVSLEEALGGKEFVLLYASAHWCGPCRQFTPQLASWYNSLGANRTIEVVFLSADHDESGFNGYYSTMPWMAVPYDNDGREALMGHIRVSGIPRLAVVDGKTGKIIEDNAVGKSFDMGRWRTLAAAR